MMFSLCSRHFATIFVYLLLAIITMITRSDAKVAKKNHFDTVQSGHSVTSSYNHKPFLLLISLEGDFYALDYENEGALMWKSNVFSPIISASSKSEFSNNEDSYNETNRDSTLLKIALEPVGPGYIYSFDDGGRLILPWKQTIPELVFLSPVILSDERILIGSKQSFMIYIDVSTGAISTSKAETRECVAPNPTVLILGKTVYSVRIVNQRSGAVYWNITYTEYKSPFINLPPPAVYERWAFIGSDHEITAFLDGIMTWSISFQTPMSALFYIDPHLKAHPIDISLKSSSVAPVSSNTDDDDDDGGGGIISRKAVIQRDTLTGAFLISNRPWNYREFTPAKLLTDDSGRPQKKDMDLIYGGDLVPWNWINIEGSSDNDISENYNFNDRLESGNLLLPPPPPPSTPARQIDPPQIPFPNQRSWWSRKSFLIPSSVAIASIIALIIVIYRARGKPSNQKKGPSASKKRKKTAGSKAPESLSKIQVSEDILGFGSHGTVVYRGKFENRDVAVKRMLLDFYDLADLEISLLLQSDDHPNVIRYFCQEKSDRFLYIALELCVATLAECVEREEIWLSLRLNERNVLRELSQGIAHLHERNIIHRDIKPHNVLVTSKGRIMVSDFGLSKRLDQGVSSFQTAGNAGTHGWRAPEIVLISLETENVPSGSSNPNETQSGNRPSETLISKRMTKAVDSFALGCVFYYVLTRGFHPFGDLLSREMNIANGVSVMDRNLPPEPLDLVSSLISVDPRDRPSMNKVLEHVYFWTGNDRLFFLQELSDKLDALGSFDPVVQRFEQLSFRVFKRDWDLIIDKSILEETFRYRKYETSKLKDLLRVIRNKKHHFLDLPEQQRRILGTLPDGFCQYFGLKFPRLLLECFSFVLTEPDLFELYFVKSLLKHYGRNNIDIPSPIQNGSPLSDRK